MIWSWFGIGRQMKMMMRLRAKETHMTVACVSYCCRAEKIERKRVCSNSESVRSTLSRCPSDLIALSFFFWSVQRRGDQELLTVDHIVPVIGRLTLRHKSLQAILLQLESIGCFLTNNPKSFLLLLRIFWRGGMHAMFFQAYHHMEFCGFVPNTFARNLLMDTLFRIGKPNLALSVFDHIQPPNFSTFNTTLFHLSNLTTHLPHITYILKLMLRIRYYPNAHTFHSLLNSFCKMDALLEAYQLLGLMVVLGTGFSVHVWTILIHKHCQLGRLDVATDLLQNMVQTGCSPNVVTYTTLFKAFMESKMVTDAFHLLNIMFSAGHFPDLVLYNVLIDCLSKVGRHQDAIDAFLTLSEQNIQPDSYTFTSLLPTLCLSRMSNLLPKFALVCGHIDADLVFCNALLNSFIRAGHPSLAVRFYDHMIDEGFAPDKYSFAGLLRALCAVGRIDKAVNVYRGGVMSYQETDAHIHTVITDELIKAGKYHKAASIFKLAVKNKYPLDSVAYAVGICAVLRSGTTLDACTFYDQMKENGLKPNAHICNMMLFRFCKERDLQNVNQMLTEMVGSRIQLSDRNFFNLCNFPCTSDAYFSISNLLAEMREMDLLPVKALHALSVDKYAESLKEKYEHCANTECNLVLDSSSSEDLSDVAASVG